MSCIRNYEDKIYSSNMTALGDNVFEALQKTIVNNGGVGTITGYFDSELTILSVSELLLYNIGYTYESFMKQTKGSLKNLFYGESSAFWMKNVSPLSKGEEKGGFLQQTDLRSMCIFIRRIQQIRMVRKSGRCLYRLTGNMRI